MELEGFVSPAPNVSLFYTVYPAIPSPEASPSTSPSKDALDFSKPTVLLLHSLFWDVTCFRYQTGDPEFRSRFNAIGFDFRCSGRSKNELDPKYDPSVAAADIVISLSKVPVRLPSKLHILSADCFATAVAIQIGVFFPELVASMTVQGISQTDTPDSPEVARANAFQELADFWLKPVEREDFFESITHCIELFFGPKVPQTTLDEVAELLLTRYGPAHGAIGWYCFNPFQYRKPVPLELLQEINWPTLIFNGEKDIIYPAYYAEGLQDRLKAAKIHRVTIPDAGHTCFLLQYREFNKAFLGFMDVNFPIQLQSESEETPALIPTSTFQPDLERGLKQARRMGASSENISTSSIHPADFYTAEKRKEYNVDALEALHESDERNQALFPDWPVWWDEIDGTRIDRELPFKFSQRHGYLEKFRPPLSKKEIASQVLSHEEPES